MSASIHASTERVAHARAAGDAAPLAHALLEHADALARAARLAEALQAIDEAAELQHRRGAAADERRCLLLAAETARLLGRPAATRAYAQRALAGADAAGVAQVQALLAGAALAEGDAASADALFGQALGALPDATAPAWWRGRALARAALGRFDDAAQDLEAAARRCTALGDLFAAHQAAIEAATAWQRASHPDRAAALIEQTLATARAAGDRAALGSLELLRATLSLESGDAAAAREQLLGAREHALAARAPDTYIAAVSGLSRIAEQAGERLDAYAMLATGWATVSDVLGPRLAREAFAPQLKVLRERWGTVAFDAVRATYETERRAATSSVRTSPM